MKKALKLLKKNWIRAWLIGVIVLSSMFAAYAAYTEVSSVKRVVSTVNMPALLFSSNCMNSPTQYRRLHTSSYEVMVCNYDQKTLTYATEVLPYKIEFYMEYADGSGTNKRITDSTTYEGLSDALKAGYIDYSTLPEDIKTKIAGGAYTVRKTSGDEGADETVDAAATVFHFTDPVTATKTYTSQTLAGNHASTDKYTVTINNEDCTLPEAQLFIHAKATKLDGSNYWIDGLLFGQETTSDAALWTGSITDTTAEPDFFNYLITGSGKGTVEILWNPDKIDINKYFLNIYQSDLLPANVTVENAVTVIDSQAAEHPGWKKISLAVDSAERYRYELQLFKKAGFNDDDLAAIKNTDPGQAATIGGIVTDYIICNFS